MALSAEISPVNSLVFIHDVRGWTSPLPVDGKLISSTSLVHRDRGFSGD